MPIVQSTDYSRCANKLFSQSRANCQTTKPRASICIVFRNVIWGGEGISPLNLWENEKLYYVSVLNDTAKKMQNCMNLEEVIDDLVVENKVKEIALVHLA